jgi:hypothetical protein
MSFIHSPSSLMQFKTVHSLTLIYNNFKITSIAICLALHGHLQAVVHFLKPIELVC